MQTTANYGLKKPEGNDTVDIDVINGNMDTIDTKIKNNEDSIGNLQGTVNSHLADAMYQTAGGTSVAIILTICEKLNDGFPVNFKCTSSNLGSPTTINGKSFYKLGGTLPPNLIAGKYYTAVYNASSDCFFIKASTEGTAVAENVLAGTTFSNDRDTGISGTMPNNGPTNGVIANQGGTIIVNEGYTMGGIITANITNLTSSNINNGVIIGGITGTGNKYGVGDIISVSKLFGGYNEDRGSIVTTGLTVETPSTQQTWNKHAICKDNNGYIYIAYNSSTNFTYQGANVICKYNVITGTLIWNVSITSQGSINSMHTDGNYIALALDGYNINTRSINVFNCSDGSQVYSYVPTYVPKCVYVGKNGVYTSDGNFIIKYKKTSNNVIWTCKCAGTYLVEDTSENIYVPICGYGSGFYIQKITSLGIASITSAVNLESSYATTLAIDISNNIYVNSGSHVYSFDCDTLSTRWNTAIGSVNSSSICIDGNGNPIFFDSGKLYILSSSNGIVLINGLSLNPTPIISNFNYHADVCVASNGGICVDGGQIYNRVTEFYTIK